MAISLRNQSQRKSMSYFNAVLLILFQVTEASAGALNVESYYVESY